MTADRETGAALLLSAAIGAYYAILGLVILVPEGVYSGDIGVQFVQARALLDNGFRSLDIGYPGAFLDPTRALFPLRPPFVMHTDGTTQSIFPPATAVLQAIGVGALGLRGMILISVLAGWATLMSTLRLAPPGARVLAVVALGLASPLWFYAVSGWHHAAAMAAGSAAFMLALTRSGTSGALLAGLALGAGAALRDEVILLAPGLSVALWMRHREIRPLLLAGLGALVALGTAAAIEVAWFGRPLAAHLRHAVHLLQRALQTTREANLDVPVLEPMTLQERYATVVQYWLLGFGRNDLIAGYVAGLLAALALRWRFGTPAGILVWLSAVLILAAQDFHELVTAPKWLAGLFRVAPYLVFVLLPVPRNAAPWTCVLTARIALVTLAAYVAIAFVGVDTTGGKGLGPRLLLPLLPLLTVPAVVRIVQYLQAQHRLERLAGYAGAALLGMALVMHTYGTTYAYYMRNRDDSSVVRAVARAPERIVVADEMHTAQLLLPLYYRKIVLLADTPYRAAALSDMIEAQRLAGALQVTRNVERPLLLPGLRVLGIERIGRMSITHWGR